MSRAAGPKRGSSKTMSSSRISTSRGIRQSWDAPEDYVNAAVFSAVGTEHVILRDGRTTAVAPSVTVYTNIAGAVAVTVDQVGLDAGRRLRSRILPENVFNPFRCHHETKNTTPVGCAVKNLAAGGGGGAAGESGDGRRSNENIRSSVAACNAAEEMINGVREELNRWTLQTRSRRESTMLRKHENSRYASNIEYHRGQPSASRSGSRPLSTAIFLRSFSTAGPHDHQMKHQNQRSSSALPPRSLRANYTPEHDKGMGACVSSTEHWGQETRPRSAFPRWGMSAQAEEESLDIESQHTRRDVSASGNNGLNYTGVVGSTNSLGAGSTERSGRRQGAGSVARRPRTSSTQRGDDDCAVSEDDQEVGDDVYDHIYEDLDEDDGELDNRISIMENRFSTLGRERTRPNSAIDRYGDEEVYVTGRVIDISREPQAQASSKNDYHTSLPARNMRPPRAPSLSARTTTTRRLASAALGTSIGKRAAGIESLCASDADGIRPPRIIKIRPISAPSGGSPLSTQRSDPTTALRTRRDRGDVSRATAPRVVLNGQVSAFDVEQLEEQQQQPPRRLSRLPIRDVTTAIPSWDRCGDGGGSRPQSSSTIVAGVVGDESGGSNSRPSSAAFRRWMDARPSARSAVSAVSSARTLGMDDPELVHLQMEMESRRGGMSEATLARIEGHYTAVARKNEPARKAAYAKVKGGRPPSAQKVEPNRGLQPTTAGAQSLLSNKHSGTGEGTASTGSVVKSRGRSTGRGHPATSRGSSMGSSGRSSPSRSKTNNRAEKKISKQRNRKKKGRSGSPGKTGRGKRTGKGKGRSKWNAIPRTVHASAAAFMAEHFPTADDRDRDPSHLGMKQLEECRRASEALGRAGVSVSSEALRRALVIPTDRPIEACLAALPTPLEGFRDKPLPIVPNPATNSMRQTAAAVHLSGWKGDRGSDRTKRLPPGESAAGRRARRKVKGRAVSPPKRLKSTRA